MPDFPKIILFGISSGIAAFKIVSLIRHFKRHGHESIVLMTEHAVQMIPPAQFEKASGNKVAYRLFPEGFDYKAVLRRRRVEHISLAEKAALICIAPATANIIAKLAHGIADDLLGTVVLATQAPVLICPSMNPNMWNKPITQSNVNRLIAMGYHVLKPASGRLACGAQGLGRLPSPASIRKEIIKMLDHGKQFAGKRIIVTAGGTEEPVDAVRILGNRSSGKMGVCLAEELSSRGAEVTLIHGRMEVWPCRPMKLIRTMRVEEMAQALRRVVANNDALVHAAAVGDFRARSPLAGKMDSKRAERALELVRTPKIIDTIKRLNPNIVLVGFKAETGPGLGQAAAALIERSGADMVVANDVGGKPVFGHDENEVLLAFPSRKARLLKRTSKRKIAEEVVDELAFLLKRRLKRSAVSQARVLG
ncbi:MAG TPA: bifunctional phosphopantothenoylcysteine decarboxylase/phosphopantothenate--cysteine ligase CoaBC [Elusimicrobia bacterium]|nr:bifunctional phosphopantothenoylcysteine decarboxylase/phosphopantothenate--cysteine ligase CoaBC [Elusimicrobiota bacterium]HBT61245.1 bifunctional phosphopantothenoylcysteine decarboxylase/phosphopantothenate--cysteine ligase CoaBC [Elusimicrobiota bacterium]